MSILTAMEPATATGQTTQKDAALQQMLGPVPKEARLTANSPAVQNVSLSLGGTLADGKLSGGLHEQIAGVQSPNCSESETRPIAVVSHTQKGREIRMRKLEGKVAVITGGNSGIGLATAKLLRQEGAKVAISGRDQTSLTAAAKEIGGDTLAIRSDVSSIAGLDAFFEKVAQTLGKIDVLFANAGVAKFAPIGDSTESLYDEVFDINVKGVFFTIQKALPHLNDGASIVLNTTFMNGAGAPGTSVYAASKAAVRSFARTAAAELVGRGIRVSAVSPGPIATPIFGRLGLPKEAVDELAQSILSTVPMKRIGQPEEIASAVLFLASSDASYITGVELNVDGGAGQV